MSFCPLVIPRANLFILSVSEESKTFYKEVFFEKLYLYFPKLSNQLLDVL